MSRILRSLAVFGVALVVFGPLGLIVYQSFLNEPFFSPSARFSLDAYRYVLADSGFHAAFGTSLLVSLGMMLIAVPLGLLALAGRPRPGQLARRAAALSLVPLALAAFCAHSYRLSGDPLGWLHAQSQWGYSVGHRPWVELMRLVDGIDSRGLYGYFFSDPLAPYYFLHGVVALAFVALLPSVFARLGPALGAYVAVSLLVPLTGNALEGIGRYAATLFPVFMLLGSATSQRVHEAILIGSALVLSLLAGLFAGFYPIY